MRKRREHVVRIEDRSFLHSLEMRLRAEGINLVEVAMLIEEVQGGKQLYAIYTSKDLSSRHVGVRLPKDCPITVVKELVKAVVTDEKGREAYVKSYR